MNDYAFANNSVHHRNNRVSLQIYSFADKPDLIKGEEYIIYGYSDGTFRGENYIQRDEAAAMLIRAFYAWFN